MNNDIYGENVHLYINIAGKYAQGQPLARQQDFKNVGSVLKPTHSDLSPDLISIGGGHKGSSAMFTVAKEQLTVLEALCTMVILHSSQSITHCCQG